MKIWKNKFAESSMNSYLSIRVLAFGLWSGASKVQAATSKSGITHYYVWLHRCK